MSSVLPRQFTRMTKRALIGTPFEGVARAAYERLCGSALHPGDAEIVAVMRRVLRSNSSCVDVGAHKGLLLREMAALAPAGRHAAFEPIPRLYAQLVRRFPPHDRMRIFSYALSDVAGTSQFYLNVDHPAYSGLRRRRYPSRGDRVETIDVEVRRLDDVLGADWTVDFLKLDVEGAELAVLRGAARLVERCRPAVLFEFGRGSAEFYRATPNAIHGFFAQRHYAIYTLPVYLAGDAALDLAAFEAEYDRNEQFNFIALPRTAT